MNFTTYWVTNLITGVGIVLTTLGGVFIDEVKSFVGIESDEPQTEQVEVEHKQEVNVQGPTIVVNIPEQKEKVVTKTIIVKPKVKKKEKEEVVDW
jgi:hypothetical protein